MQKSAVLNLLYRITNFYFILKRQCHEIEVEIRPYTVPKAFLMHETFPDLPGNIEQVVVVATNPDSFGKIYKHNFSRQF
jgi:hypothetical protein